MLKLKDKKCKHCRNLFTPVRPLQNACGITCAIELEKIKKDKEWKKRKREGLLKLKTMGEYEYDARVEFQKWTRERDKHLPCISCNVESTTQWDGGHYFKAELYSGLIFHEDNCHKQCSRCNNELHGNEANYRMGLVKKIGLERVQWLEDNKDRLRQYKYTKEELISIKNKYKQKLKELKQQNK